MTALRWEPTHVIKHTSRIIPLQGCRLLDNFPDHVSFYLCDRSNGHTRKLQFDVLDRLCHEAFSDSSTLVVATDASVIPPRNMQTVSVAHF